MTQRRSQFGTPSVWVALKKFPHPAGRICGCLLIVFQPVTKHGPAGLKLRVVETVVNAGVDDLLDRHPVGAPGVNFLGAVCRRRPLVEASNKNERGGITRRPTTALHKG